MPEIALTAQDRHMPSIPFFSSRPSQQPSPIEAQLLANAKTPAERRETENLFAQVKQIRNAPDSSASTLSPPAFPLTLKNVLLSGLYVQAGVQPLLNRESPLLPASSAPSALPSALVQVHSQPYSRSAPPQPETPLLRQARHVVPKPKTTTTTAAPDDVKIVKMFDFSCMNEGENLPFAQVLRQIGKTLRNPITALATESKHVDSWRQGRGCATSEEISAITDITEKVDAITSQVLTLLPGSQPLAIAQYIVGPLLEHAANDLEGKPTSREEELNLLQQVTQQARFSIDGMSHAERQRLQTAPQPGGKASGIDLPAFHLKNGRNHIKLKANGKHHDVALLEKDGRSFAQIPAKQQGKFANREVYFNHLAQEWRLLGDGKFRHFSKQEQLAAHKLALGPHHLHRSSSANTPHVYSVHNSFTAQPARLEAIELFGRLVPYRHELATGKEYIYDARRPDAAPLEVENRLGEWHIKHGLTRQAAPELRAAIAKHDIAPLALDERQLSTPNHFGIQRTGDGQYVLAIDQQYYPVQRHGKQVQLGGARNLQIELSAHGKRVEVELAKPASRDNPAFKLVDMPIIGKPLKIRAARKAIGKALPIAQTKIANAIQALNRSDLRPQVQLAEEAYFGKTFHQDPKRLAQLGKYLDQIQGDLARIDTANFNFDSRVGSPTTVAELSREQYQMLGRKPKSKIINVGRDGFYAYYERMGKNPSAVADVLIHELSHGGPNTLDFAYVGTQKQARVGDVDVFELINLANKHIEKDSRYGGADLPQIDNINIAFKGLKNADSIAQFVSFLGKADSDPAGFERDYQTLKAAADRSDHFQQRLPEGVPVSRNRRSIETPVPSLPPLLLLVERQSGRYHLYRPLAG